MESQLKYNYFSYVYVLLMTNLSQRSSLLKMQCVLGGKYWSGGFYNCFDFQLNCRCQYQETPHPNVQLNAIFNINSILVFDYLRNSPKYMTFSRYVKLKTSYFGLPLIQGNDRIVPVYVQSHVWQFHVSITIIYRSLPSIKIVFYLLTDVNLYNIHIQINKYTMSAIEI